MLYKFDLGSMITRMTEEGLLFSALDLDTRRRLYDADGRVGKYVEQFGEACVEIKIDRGVCCPEDGFTVLVPLDDCRPVFDYIWEGGHYAQVSAGME